MEKETAAAVAAMLASCCFWPWPIPVMGDGLFGAGFCPVQDGGWKVGRKVDRRLQHSL